ncbi:unnamed protein product [Wuchereria bancrofti]|uniref:Serpin domain-containing protein n=1 Tax=Wuchereria bancrofti TaxID=6293 RepID=A0A3P7DRY2_WUCBA|nr:unnamed protein product [Wuchereria bancrofti]
MNDQSVFRTIIDSYINSLMFEATIFSYHRRLSVTFESIFDLIQYCINSSTNYAHLNFAVDLMKEIGRNDGTEITSPASISIALFMIYLGANGKTKQELSKIFGRGKFTLNGRKSNNYILNIANRLYIRQEFSIKPNFSFLLQFYFSETLYKFNDEQIGQLTQVIINS